MTLDEIEKLCQAATPGPWKRDYTSIGPIQSDYEYDYGARLLMEEPDAKLIEACPIIIPELVKRIRLLEDSIDAVLRQSERIEELNRHLIIDLEQAHDYIKKLVMEAAKELLESVRWTRIENNEPYLLGYAETVIAELEKNLNDNYNGPAPAR